MGKLDAIRLRVEGKSPEDLYQVREDRRLLLEYLDIAGNALAHCDQQISKQARRQIGMPERMPELVDPDEA